MSRSLFARLYFVLSLFIITIFFINYYFTLKTFRQHQVLVEKENLVRIAGSLKSSGAIKSANVDTLRSFVEETGKMLNVRLRVIDKSGRVLADSQISTPAILANPLDQPEILEALKSDYGFAIRPGDVKNHQALFLAEKITGDFDGFIVASVLLPDMGSFLAVFKKNIFFLALVLLGLSLSASFLLTRSVTDPLEKLAHITNQVAGGNFDVEIPVIGSGEISGLAENFAIMTRKIKNLFLDISRQKEELGNIIEAVQEKLLIVDSNGIILSANKGFDDLMHAGAGELAGRAYKKVIDNEQITGIIDQTIRKQTGIMEEAVIDGRVYLCSSAFMPDIRESVLVMRDISELKNLENIKRDLIANVSHELRTPLTAIKGFLETLKDNQEENGDPRKRTQNIKYIDIIERHTDRLIFIVQDLLILSRLEDQAILPQYQSLKLTDIVKDTFLLLEKKARQKNLELNLVEKNQIDLEGDRNQLVQLFINLIDNAIKYTEKGEIRVTLTEDSGFAIIEIRDTGIGIDKKHLGRLFERFYVVDSSRSRIQGGTGLGLSIVKHVVGNHKGKVDIDSQTGRGTTVRIALPMRQIL